MVVEGVSQRIMIVEGKTDKNHLKTIIDEDIEIICTFGTLGVERLDELIHKYDLDHQDVFVLVDEDDSGQSIRNMLIRELPHAIHLYVSEAYREVALTPRQTLAIDLVKHGIKVKPDYLNATDKL